MMPRVGQVCLSPAGDPQGRALLRITPRAESVGFQKRLGILLWKVIGGEEIGFLETGIGNCILLMTKWDGSRAFQNPGPWDGSVFRTTVLEGPLLPLLSSGSTQSVRDVSVNYSLLALWCRP